MSGDLRRGVERPAEADLVLDEMIDLVKKELEMMEGHRTAR